jgi:hypothetical protein
MKVQGNCMKVGEVEANYVKVGGYFVSFSNTLLSANR